MKIAIIADPLDNQRAGVHVYVRELVKALIANPGPHEYILIRERVDPELDIEQVAIPNTRLPIGFASLRLFFLVPLKLRQLGVDAVYEPAHFGPFNLPRSIKRITMIHDLTPILFPQFHNYHSQLLQKIFLPRILRRTDLVIANSHNTRDDLLKVYPFLQSPTSSGSTQERSSFSTLSNSAEQPEHRTDFGCQSSKAGKEQEQLPISSLTDKVAMIHLGVSDFFRPDDRQDFLEAHGIQHPYFLYVGTIEPRKNLLQLLEAYQQFREGGVAKTLLVLVGQIGWKSKAFDEALSAHPFREDIILTGYIKKEFLPQAYYHALSLIYPSVYEGFGFPIAEAMACGGAVICPDNSSLPEVGGELARYYSTYDTRELSEIMWRVALQGLPTVNRRKAYSAWAARFSWESYAIQFNTIMSSLSNRG
ncbi:hypothetical protein CEQ90_08940 [Lewinellaceae bacterium SD302]|nr:hypothetical protein CEQ90_08940 [Lewinellaceae bacterium SD302]